MLLVIPFGRVVEPAQKEGTHSRSVCEDEEGVNSVLFIVAVDSPEELMYSYRHVERALSEWEACVEFTVICKLTLVLLILIRIQLSPFFVGNGVEESKLLLGKRYVLAYIGDAKRLIEFVTGLPRS